MGIFLAIGPVGAHSLEEEKPQVGPHKGRAKKSPGHKSKWAWAKR